MTTAARLRKSLAEAVGPGAFPAAAVLTAVVFAGASLTPSLMPRAPLYQGLLAGSLAAVGYSLGVALIWLWRFLQIPMAAAAHGRIWRWGLNIASAAIAALCIWKAADWQNETRVIMGLPAVRSSHPFTILIVGLAAFLTLWLFGWLFTNVLGWLRRQLDRILPPRVGMALGFVIVVWVFWAAVDGLLVRTILNISDASLEARDRFIDPELPQPGDPRETGSSASLVKWNEMGRWGRSYVSTAPTREQIAEFTRNSPPAMAPIRVYVGRLSRETPRERAELALKELIRVGGFERKNLVVMVPTGTGWMDPKGNDTLEFMLGGDVATVAAQYSYLSSALALATTPDYGTDQARELFDAIYKYWTALPRDKRPRLYVHGLSLGALNSQSTLPLLDLLSDPINGALWTGSPFFSPFWQRVRTHRAAGSTSWRPRYGNGSLMRVVNQGGRFDEAAASWGPIRMVFLNYASDPIVCFSFSSAYQSPDWLERPRAHDISDKLIWFPLVTMLQTAFDTSIALDVPGFGHDYVARDYIDAWAAVLDPPGWSPQRADELKAIFERRSVKP